MDFVCSYIRLEMCVLCVSERGFHGQRQAEIGEERYQHRKRQGDKVCVLLPFCLQVSFLLPLLLITTSTNDKSNLHNVLKGGAERAGQGDTGQRTEERGPKLTQHLSTHTTTTPTHTCDSNRVFRRGRDRPQPGHEWYKSLNFPADITDSRKVHLLKKESLEEGRKLIWHFLQPPKGKHNLYSLVLVAGSDTLTTTIV